MASVTFNKIKIEREALLIQVNECSSNEQLKELEKNQSTLKITSLKASDAAVIAGLDQKLAKAFQAKKTELAAKNLYAGNPMNFYSPYGNSDEQPIDLNKERQLMTVREQIKLVRKKAEYFNDQYKMTNDINYLNAYNAANSLAKDVENLTNLYALNKNNEWDLHQFKEEAKLLFKDNRKDIQELQKHRGWKEVLVNVLAAILGGVFYLAAAAYKGSFLVFKPATDSIKKINELEKSIDNLKEEPELDSCYNYSCC